jgi:hypothetical protein
MVKDVSKKMKKKVKALRKKAEKLEGLAEDKLHDITKSVKQKVNAVKRQK